MNRWLLEGGEYEYERSLEPPNPRSREKEEEEEDTMPGGQPHAPQVPASRPSQVDGMYVDLDYLSALTCTKPGSGSILEWCCSEAGIVELKLWFNAAGKPQTTAAPANPYSPNPGHLPQTPNPRPSTTNTPKTKPPAAVMLNNPSTPRSRQRRPEGDAPDHDHEAVLPGHGRRARARHLRPARPRVKGHNSVPRAAPTHLHHCGEGRGEVNTPHTCPEMVCHTAYKPPRLCMP